MLFVSIPDNGYWIVTRASVFANSYPGHIRGPAPNPIKLQGGIEAWLSNLVGSNFDGSVNMLSSMWVIFMVQNIYLSEIELSLMLELR